MASDAGSRGEDEELEALDDWLVERHLALQASPGTASVCFGPPDRPDEQNWERPCEEGETNPALHVLSQGQVR